MDAGQLDAEAQAGLYANRAMIQARRRIESGQGFTSHEDAFATVYNAYGSVELAEKARLKFNEALVEASCNAAARKS